MTAKIKSHPCQVCGSSNSNELYRGNIRDGAYGKAVNGVVVQCDKCGIARLENGELAPEAYSSGEYRSLLGQAYDPEKYLIENGKVAGYMLEVLQQLDLNDKVIVDVGAGAGALLDYLNDYSSELIAIEPDKGWQKYLISRGYEWFENLDDALVKYAGKVDLCISSQVIEHVESPVDFLVKIRKLLKKDAYSINSTPNRNDILMQLLPDLFPSFFYRSQHKWYFDASSLENCLQLSGFQENNIIHFHRYGLSNAFSWLKRMRPSNDSGFEFLGESVDLLWRRWVESEGYSDNLFSISKKK